MKIAMAGMESQKVQFLLVETREEEIDSPASSDEDDDAKEGEQMHVLALLARAVASARVYRELAGVALLSDVLKAAYRGLAMAEEECQDMEVICLS
mmetsp:Transcript_116440/g.375095  ORF Transcript_116440/g.375095 Transcript_116440/m.375095 type:complete len:96 (+) Transcript_116440:146-433(+)